MGDASMIARWKTLMTTVQARAAELKKQGRTARRHREDDSRRVAGPATRATAWPEWREPPTTRRRSVRRLSSMDTELAIGFVWFLAFLFSTTVHEAMHALVAWKGGDPTAYHGGQVSLSPIPHIKREPIGMLVVPLVTSLTQGWAMGWASAPLRSVLGRAASAARGAHGGGGPGRQLPDRADRLRWTPSWSDGGSVRVSGAGDVSRAGCRRIDGWADFSGTVLSVLLVLNVFIGLFNLLPLPPLDGFSVVSIFLPEEHAAKWRALQSNAGMSMVGSSDCLARLSVDHRSVVLDALEAGAPRRVVRLVLLLRADEHARHDVVVAFVAGELVQRLFPLPQRHRRRPRSGPRRGIGERHLVRDRVRRYARESLDERQMLGRAHEVALVGEVGRLDDKRVAFPTAAGVAVPLTNAGPQMRAAVERNDAGFVAGFHVENDDAWRLEDLVVAHVAGPVATAQARHAPGDAAQGVADIRGHRGSLKGGVGRDLPAAAFRSQRRNPCRPTDRR